MKRLLQLAFALLVWSGITIYGAVEGWWLKRIAPRGDAPAFMTAAARIADAESHGNIAMVLLRRGEVAGELYRPSIDTVDRDTRFPLASMSKYLTAYAVMQLVQAGRVELDAPVSTYLRQWQLPTGTFDAKDVTVRRLLSHTAGLTDGLGFADYLPTESLPSLSSTLREPRASSGTKAIVVGQAPGDFQYSGGGYLVLQALVEDVTGVPFATWMDSTVFRPMQMRTASYAYLGDLDHVARSFDAQGNLAPTYRYAAAGATGLSASARDLVAFAQAQVRADRAQAPLLNTAHVTQMRAPHGKRSGLAIWGLGVALYAPTKKGGYVYGHDGSNAPAINSTLRINPDNGDALIVLVTGNPNLASRIGFEWTVWQTGVGDFLMLERSVRSALLPLGVGYLLIVVAAVVLWIRRRRV